MSPASEIASILRQAGDEKLSARDIHARGGFHDLQTTLQVLQRHSNGSGFLVREKTATSGTFVYGIRPGATLPQDVAEELAEPAAAEPPTTPTAPAVARALPTPATSDRSAARLHEHLFKTLEDLENGKIDHLQAKARAVVADQIIKLANVQLLFAQLKQSEQIPGELARMPLVGSSEP